MARMTMSSRAGILHQGRGGGGLGCESGIFAGEHVCSSTKRASRISARPARGQLGGTNPGVAPPAKPAQGIPQRVDFTAFLIVDHSNRNKLDAFRGGGKGEEN